jgi:LmbE family N-acetylglucosaminyl deacetylase
MRLSFANERVLAVMAHPDDAELLCAGTLARAAADGAGIGVCVTCQGDKGVPAGGLGADAAAVRRSEAEAAAKVLGATVLWFGAKDGELFDTYEARRRMIEIFRQFEPTLVIAHCPEDYHADHRAASAIAEAATWMCSSRGQVTESAAMEKPPGLWLADSIGMGGFTPEFYLDVSPFVEVKQRMLGCHQSQLLRGTEKDFSPLAELMERQYRVRGEQACVKAAEAFRQHHAFKRARAW